MREIKTLVDLFLAIKENYHICDEVPELRLIENCPFRPLGGSYCKCWVLGHGKCADSVCWDNGVFMWNELAGTIKV